MPAAKGTTATVDRAGLRKARLAAARRERERRREEAAARARPRPVRGESAAEKVPEPTTRPRHTVSAAARDQAELGRYGFVGASERSNVRDLRRRAAEMAPTTNRQQAHPVSKAQEVAMRLNQSSAVPGVDYVSRQLREVGGALAGAPAGTYELWHALTEPQEPGAPTVGPEMRRYLHGFAESNKEIFSHPVEHAGLAALTLGGLAAPAASGVSRGAAASGALARGEGTAAALRAAAEKPMPRERTLRYTAVKGQPPIEVAVPGTTNKAFEPLQRLMDAARERNPRLGFSSGPAITRNQPSRVGWELAQNRRIERGLDQAEAFGLAKATKLSAMPRKRPRQQVEQTAARVEFEGASVDERIALHDRLAAETRNPVQRKRHERKAGLLRQAAALLEENGAGPRVAMSNAALRDLMDRAQRVAAGREESLLAREAIVPEQAAGRVQMPGRVIKGARYEPRSLAERRDKVPEQYQEQFHRDLIGMYVVPHDRRNIGRITEYDPISDEATVRFFNKATKGRAEVSFPLDELTRSGERGGRIVGEEGFSGGTTRVPYEAPWENTPLGRVTLGSGRSIGVPREQSTVTQSFKAGRLLSGDFRDDALRLIAEDAIREGVQTSKLRFRDQLLRASTTRRVHDGQIPIRLRVARDPKITAQVRDVMAGYDERVQPKKRLREATKTGRLETLREQIFPSEINGVPVSEIPAGQSVPGIRWVDERLLEGSNLPPISLPFQQTPGMRAIATGWRGLNNAMRLGFFYLTGKYGPANVGGQVTLNIVQAGHKLPAAYARATVMHRPGKLGKERTAVVDEGMGSGVGHAIVGDAKGPLGATTAKAAELWSIVLDTGFRRAAWQHEASAAGFDTTAKQRKLIDDAVAGDEKARRDYIILTRRARSGILDYERLGRVEEAGRQLAFIYPFTKASTVYVGHFLLEHPVKAAVAGQVGLQGQEALRRTVGAVPSFLEGAIAKRDEKGNVSLASPMAFSPVGPGIQVMQSAGSFGAGSPRPSELPTQYLNPVLRAGLNAATRYDPFFQRNLDQHASTPGLFLSQLRDMLPQYRLYKGLTNPTAGREDVIYPRSRADAVEDFMLGPSRFRRVNAGEIVDRAESEARSNLPPAERQWRRVAEERRKVFEAAKAKAPGELENGRLPKALRDAFNRKAERFAAYALAEQKKKDDLTVRDKYVEDVRLFARWGVVSPDEARAGLEWARSASDEEVARQRRGFSRDQGPYGSAYLVPIRFAKKGLGLDG